MTKVKTEAQAKKIAETKGLCWGLSVFDGWFYVGTPTQLSRIGAIK